MRKMKGIKWFLVVALAMGVFVGGIWLTIVLGCSSDVGFFT